MSSVQSVDRPRILQTPEAVVMGVSAGAVEALGTILPQLPADFPLPILVVVHLPPDHKSMLVEMFQRKCQMKVKEAEDKEAIRGGAIYFAPPDYHLLVEQDRRLSLSTEEPVLYSRPSVDVLFETAADAYGASLLGVVLTGASSDGAMGLKAIIEAGGAGIVQDPQTAYAPVMPQSASRVCPEALVVPLEQISQYIQNAFTSG